MSRKTVVLLSGGLDSTVLLHWSKAEGHEPSALGFHYGQRHSRELESARAIAAHAAVPFKIADVRSLRDILKGSSQTSSDVEVPKGHYTDPSMKATVVPNRNMIMLSIAAGYAISIGADSVMYAAHAGDHPIYPDCRPEFVERLGQALQVAHYEPIHLVGPFVTKTKADLARLGQELDAPLHLTWSCYQGGSHHCGQCGTCVERIEAFELAGVDDPTVYRPESASVVG